LCSLVFLLPLVAAYELGALLVRPSMWPEQRLVAQRAIQQLAAWFGTDAVWVPGAALVATLILWQIVGRRPWRVPAWVPPAMILESVVLAVPLFVLGELLQQTVEPRAADPTSGGRAGLVVLALGAGIYEELVFRFGLVVGLSALLGSIDRVPKRAAAATAATLAALAFAVCHFRPIGVEAFAWPRFLVLAAAGGYLSLVFLARGLGISTGCHVAYNLIWLAVTGR
jgi:membrane protease YdiL (CAAX protease family)